MAAQALRLALYLMEGTTNSAPVSQLSIALSVWIKCWSLWTGIQTANMQSQRGVLPQSPSNDGVCGVMLNPVPAELCQTCVRRVDLYSELLYWCQFSRGYVSFCKLSRLTCMLKHLEQIGCLWNALAGGDLANYCFCALIQ